MSYYIKRATYREAYPIFINILPLDFMFLATHGRNYGLSIVMHHNCCAQNKFSIVNIVGDIHNNLCYSLADFLLMKRVNITWMMSSSLNIFQTVMYAQHLEFGKLGAHKQQIREICLPQTEQIC